MPGFVTGHIEAIATAQLYNLRTAPAESENLATQHPDLVKLITKLADESRADLGDFTGPGSGDRFFDEGSQWPSTAERPTKLGVNLKSVE